MPKRIELDTSAAASTPVNVDQRVQQLQDTFPAASELLQQKVSQLESAQREPTRLSHINRRWNILFAAPVLGLPIVAKKAVRTAKEVIQRVGDDVHNIEVDRNVALEKITFEAALQLFKASNESALAKRLVNISLGAWQQAEEHHAQHPHDIEGTKRKHGLAIGVLETAAAEFGIFEAIDTSIKGKFDVNLPEIGRVLGAGFVTKKLIDGVKGHIPTFNTYLAAMANTVHPEEMAPRFAAIAQAQVKAA